MGIVGVPLECEKRGLELGEGVGLERCTTDRGVRCAILVCAPREKAGKAG